MANAKKPNFWLPGGLIAAGVFIIVERFAWIEVNWEVGLIILSIGLVLLARARKQRTTEAQRNSIGKWHS